MKQKQIITTNVPVPPVAGSGTLDQKNARAYLLLIYKQLKQSIDQPTQVNVRHDSSETSVHFQCGLNQISINMTEG